MIAIYRIVDSRTAVHLALESPDPATVTAHHSPATSLLRDPTDSNFDSNGHALGRRLADSKGLSVSQREFKTDVGGRE